MKIKTAELTGAALNWAVAKCEGVINGDALDVGFIREGGYTPSFDWAQGGPIIERECISLFNCYGDSEWSASTEGYEHHATTPLIAAMRCYVASKKGDEVDVPEEVTL